MKKYLTFLFFWLTFTLAAQINNGIIRVAVEDGCGQVFAEQVTIYLNQVVGSDIIKIDSSNSHPVEFTGLDVSNIYQVKIASDKIEDIQLSIKDIHVLRETVLGIEDGNSATILAGDASGNYGISTLDFVMMGRHLLKIQNLALNRWIFIDQSVLHINMLLVDFLNQTTVQGIPSGLKEITFNAYKYGAVASTVPGYCENCLEDSTSIAKLRLPDLEVEAGKVVEFDLISVGSDKDVGMVFSLQYKDGLVTDIFPYNSTVHNLIDSIKAIHVLTYFDVNDSPINYKTVKIKFRPSRNGKLSSFFSINDTFPNEFVYKEADCLKTYQNIVLEEGSLCPVTWPADITIPDCITKYNTGLPVIDPECKDIVAITYTDETIGLVLSCEKILRHWTALNWLTGELFKHTQVILIDKNYPTVCWDVTVLVEDSVILYARDLVKNADLSHIYSFSLENVADTVIALYGAPPTVEFLTVYDMTDSTFCFASVTKVTVGCTDPIRVISETTVNSAGTDYIVFARVFDGGNEDHCRGRISDFQIKMPNSGVFVYQAVFDYDTYKGKNVAVELRYKVDGIWENYGLVTIIFTDGNVLPPFELTCFDDPLTKDVLHEIAIFSPNFDSIFAFQGAFRVKDAVVISTKKVALPEIAFNQALNFLKFIWLQPTAEPVLLSFSDTIFTLTILPTKDGNVSEVLSIADDLLESLAILDDLDQRRIDLVFKFMRRTLVNDNQIDHDITVFPNPTASGDFTIQSQKHRKATVSIYSNNGQLIYEKLQEAADGNFLVTMPQDVQNGVYFVKLEDQQHISTQKLVLVK
ncbi:MAG: T9SS type A sorting domain-containing protein [Saprospiraceae bacterium]|nr:T9SS type A sorting domain-containing protein [Saprospiraceae bacterium]